jgi:hypothetical protein
LRRRNLCERSVPSEYLIYARS